MLCIQTELLDFLVIDHDVLWISAALYLRIRNGCDVLVNLHLPCLELLEALLNVFDLVLVSWILLEKLREAGVLACVGKHAPWIRMILQTLALWLSLLHRALIGSNLLLRNFFQLILYKLTFEEHFFLIRIQRHVNRLVPNGVLACFLILGKCDHISVIELKNVIYGLPQSRVLRGRLLRLLLGLLLWLPLFGLAETSAGLDWAFHIHFVPVVFPVAPFFTQHAFHAVLAFGRDLTRFQGFAIGAIRVKGLCHHLCVGSVEGDRLRMIRIAVIEADAR